MLLPLIAQANPQPSEANPDTEMVMTVTATRLDTPENDVASSTTVITQSQIQSKQKENVADLLREVPGVTVSNSGGSGKNTTVTIRGTYSDHVLVLIDGIEMNNAMSTNGSFNFGNLSTEDIDHIEVVRGSQSVLYGSNAVGGVIQIFTKHRNGPPHEEIEAEYGSYESYRAQGSVSGGSEKITYYLGAGHQGTQGFPAADKNLGNVIDSGQNLTTSTGTVRISEILPNTELDLKTRFSDASFGLSAGGGPPGYNAYGTRTGDDPNYTGSDRQFYSEAEMKAFLTSHWTSDLSLQYSYAQNSTDHTPTLVDSSIIHDLYSSHRIRGYWQNSFTLSDQNTLVVGLDSFIETGSSSENFDGTVATIQDQSDTLIAVFADDQFISDTFFATLGGRFDSYGNGFGSRGTYRFAPGYKITSTNTTLKGSVGTGFKVPSLYQRYSTYGDASLSPEISTSYDIGLEQAITQKTSVSLTYFQTELTDLILYNYVTQHYGNVGSAQTQGVELAFRSDLTRELGLMTSYTYTRAVDETTGLELLMQPSQLFSAALTYKFNDQLQAQFNGRFVGVREELDAVSSSQISMPCYAVFYLTGSYQARKDTRIFARIDNVLNRQYEEVSGYGTPGQSFFAGVNQGF